MPTPAETLREAVDALGQIAADSGIDAAHARLEGLRFAAAIAESAPRAAEDWAVVAGIGTDARAVHAAFFDAASSGRKWRQAPTAILDELVATGASQAPAYAKQLGEVASAACVLGEPTIRVTGNAAVAAAAQLTAARVETPMPHLSAPGGQGPLGELLLDNQRRALEQLRAIEQLQGGRQWPAIEPGGFGGPPTTDSPSQATPGAASETATEGEAAVAEEEAEPPKSLEELLGELDDLIGLDRVKKEVHQQVAILKLEKRRADAGLKTATITRHLVFVGNPGTGKTTVARMVAGIYRALGLLSKGHLVEVDRGELVAGYLGQTAIKTQEVVAKSMGGVLFIDEAYALTGDQYGAEAVNTLVKEMEDNRDDLVVIVAGYPDPMMAFIAQNPGLASRFKTMIEFADYTDQELLDILRTLASAADYDVPATSEAVIKEILAATERNYTFGNGRFVRNLLEEAIGRHAWRLRDADEVTTEQLRTLLPEDVRAEPDTTEAKGPEDVRAEPDTTEAKGPEDVPAEPATTAAKGPEVVRAEPDTAEAKGGDTASSGTMGPSDAFDPADAPEAAGADGSSPPAMRAGPKGETDD